MNLSPTPAETHSQKMESNESPMFMIRFRVKQRSPRSKFWVVVKCMVGPSDHEPGGHYSEMEIVSVPLGHDAAHAFCARLNDDEVAKEIQAHPTVTTMKERRFELRSRDKKWAILSS